MGIQINGTTDTISAVDGSLDINQNATFGNNVTIGGTLTYSDVTNIDSVGLVTAKNGLRIHAGGIDLTSGISTFSDNIQIADKIIHKDDTNTAIRFPAVDTFAVETAGDQRLRILSTGEVLINRNTAPNDINKLVVTGTSPADAYDSQLYLEGSETSGAINTGGALAFGGHDGSAVRNWGNIYGMKENGSGGNTAGYMSFHTRANGGSPAERLRIDSEGRLLLGSTSARLAVGATGDPFLQVEGLAADTAHISIIRNSASAAGPYFSFVKTRGTSDGDVTIVQDGDDIGSILFCPADGVDVNQQSAFIRGEIDGTPGSNDTPGRIVFATTADGSGTPTERLRIAAGGNISQGTATARERVHLHYDSSDENYLRFTNSTTGTAAGDGFNVGLNSSEQALIWLKENNSMLFGTNGTTALTINSSQNATFAGTVSDSKGNLRSIPASGKSSQYTLAASDAGTVVYNSSGGWIIPNNTFDAGDTVSLLNNSGSNQTITASALGTALYNTADGANIKSSTINLEARAMATVYFISGTIAYLQASKIAVS